MDRNATPVRSLPNTEEKKMKIILILSDTFRYDHIGLNGAVQVDTPEIDQFIADSVFFERAYSGSFPTVPHRFDMLTGTFSFPFRGWESIGPKDITMAEVKAMVERKINGK